MSASRIFHAANDKIIRDSAVNQITVSIDTSLWSSRKKNIVIGALRSGIASCSWEMAALVNGLLRCYGDSVAYCTKWDTCINTAHIKPEKFDELVAYTAAWVRLKYMNTPERPRWGPGALELGFLSTVDQGYSPQRIPLDSRMTYGERRDFIAEYIAEPDTLAAASRAALIDSIDRGETITITYS